MKKVILSHKYILVALIISLFTALYYLPFVPNQITWANVSYDSPNFIIAAEHLRISHPSPGSSLYNLINMAWIRVIPFGTSYFKIALLSVFSSAAVAGLLYYHTRNLISPLLWVSSLVVLSQSTVLEQYTQTALICLGAFILHEKGHRNWAYTLLSFGVMVNHLTGFLGIFFLATDYFRKESLKPFLFMFVALPLLTYIPVFNREPYIFINGNHYKDYWNYFFSQGGLTGGLAVVPPHDLWKRGLEFLALTIPIVLIFLPYMKKVWSNPLTRLPLVASLVFTFYYFSNLNPQTFTYLTPAIALFALSIGGITYPKKIAPILIGCVLTVIIVGNIFLFKPDHSAAMDFYNQLDYIPSNSMVWSKNRGWEKTTAELYNYNTGSNIDQVNLRKPIQDTSTITERIIIADNEGRLFKTVIVNPESYHVIVIRASATEVILDYLDTDIPR